MNLPAKVLNIRITMSLNDSWKLFRHLVKVNVLFNYQIDPRPVY